MKVYKRIVIDMAKNAIMKEESFSYNGLVLKCKGGGSTTTVDKEYNKRMAAIAEAQQSMATEYFDYWKSDYKPYEQAVLASQTELLPLQTELAKQEMGLAKQQMGLMPKYLEKIEKGVSAEEEMGAAKADVTQAYSGVEGEMRRAMGRMGVTPSSGRFASIQSQTARDKARDLAGAGTSARRYADEKQYERLRGLFSNGY
jgi:hypothetical protein